MMEKSSEEYKKLCEEIIDSLLGQICTSNLNYCVKGTAGGDSAKRLIYQKFEEYESKALEKMQGDILDRHKVSSCMCGAIVEAQPLAGYRNAIILKNANEIFALYVGLNILKAYMIFELLENLENEAERVRAKIYLKEHFEMKLPENICDTQKYRDNLAHHQLV